MTIKIEPKVTQSIKNKAIDGVKRSKDSLSKAVTKEIGAGLLVTGATGIAIGSFFKDFNRTSEVENYYQFKIDETTGKPYRPDIFQQASAINLYLGNDVLVTAPTGTGKTAIAQYVITKNLKEGGRTFYTTPLKALSNEKYRDFCKTYGEENVGLLTGDTKINTQAPIIIMTTEVYRNMASSKIFNPTYDEDKGGMSGLKTVIFDELQYLGDIDRGGIWEQSIMFTPKNVQILSLSATIGNNKDINSWIASTKGKEGIAVTPNKTYMPNRTSVKETILINVPPENRHVPLTFEIEGAVADIKVPRGGSKAEKLRAKKEGARISQSIYANPKDDSFKKLTAKLNEEGRLPAIYFVFSKKSCRHLLKFLSEEGQILTDEQERHEIARILKEHLDRGEYLGESLNTDALMKGYAIHNAGLLPTQKALIEELFQKKLVKVVLATETLSAGINMPAKTTVISSPRKPASTSDGGPDRRRNLSPNEFHQMAGRAGRRGIDTHGYCYVMSCNQEQKKLYEELMASPANKLESNLELDYAFITNYLSEFVDEESLRAILSKSLYVYNSQKGVDKDKLKEIINNFYTKKEILYNNGFVNENGTTLKGDLIRGLNGYEQIPIINLMHNRIFENLDSIQIAGIVGGLANIEYNIKSDIPPKETFVRNQEDTAYVDASYSVQKQMRNYQKSYSKLYPDRVLELPTKAMDHLYAWAELNAENEDSRKNWKELYTGDLKFSIKDEGSLFKEITMTTDLLKQLIDVASLGSEISKSPSDREYYASLKIKFKEALSLIQREPAEG